MVTRSRSHFRRQALLVTAVAVVLVVLAIVVFETQMCEEARRGEIQYLPFCPTKAATIVDAPIKMIVVVITAMVRIRLKENSRETLSQTTIIQ